MTSATVNDTETFAARLDVDYPQTLDRVTTAFRLIWIIPIAIILSLLTAQARSTVTIINADLLPLRSGHGLAFNAWSVYWPEPDEHRIAREVERIRKADEARRP